MRTESVRRLQRVPLREVWEREASDFTQWLEANIDVLNDVLDINLINAEREKSAGDFSIDLVAEDEENNIVIIENQLEKSDHKHLGQIITYLTSLKASKAIWIVPEARPEHVQAIAWLNQFSDVGFYIIKIEAVKIDESLPAPLLTLIIGPSLDSKLVGETKQNISERHLLRKKWWTDLIDEANGKYDTIANLTPTVNGWLGFRSGVRGASFNFVVMKHECRVELYIDRGLERGNENNAIFDKLYENKNDIEREFGSELGWERLDAKRACRIQFTRRDGGYRSPEDQWAQLQEATLKDMEQFGRAIQVYLNAIHI